jgi:hypothetical protein
LKKRKNEDYKTFHKQNKENKYKIDVYQKEYRNNNTEKSKDYNKEYYENNKEKIKEKEKEYYENNKESIRETHKEYYENNKDKLNIKINCECGGCYKLWHKNCHFKSKIHQDYLRDDNNRTP